MFRRFLLFISVSAIFISQQGCMLHKNKCDTCPSFSKNKKHRH